MDPDEQARISEICVFYLEARARWPIFLSRAQGVTQSLFSAFGGPYMAVEGVDSGPVFVLARPKA